MRKKYRSKKEPDEITAVKILFGGMDKDKPERIAWAKKVWVEGMKPMLEAMERAPYPKCYRKGSS